jgi:hypothetical protein
MTSDLTAKIWTGTFVNEFDPDESWFIEARVCTAEPEEDYPWKEQKCSRASLLFGAFEAYAIDLCEGWNLISVPDRLVDPTLKAAFSRYMEEDSYGPVTKVYYYTGGTAGTWQSAALNPTTGLWTGTITSIEPGKAYWVWSDDWDMTLMMRVAPRDPAAGLISVPLKAGWNMVGFVDISHTGQFSSARYYFASVLTEELQSVLWEYRACQNGGQWLGTALWPVGYTGHGSETHDVQVRAGQGYWFSVSSDRTLYPTVGQVND